MGFKTKIQWCDHTFNPWIGCSKVSEGCKFCYAETLMDTRYGRVKWGENGTRSRTKTWRDPIKWNREAAAAGETHKVFCASLSDVFEDRDELTPWRADLFELIDACPNLDFLLLTKRPQYIGMFWPGDRMRENVWLGTSISNQKNADQCIDQLVRWRDLSPVLFLSVEPQIDRVSLRPWLGRRPAIDWVITGGESKQGSCEPRPYRMEWAHLLIGECSDAAVPCFVKQMGSNCPDQRFKDSHGGDWLEWPADLRVRECPESFIPELVPA